jgi:hypothetical protein
MGLKLNNSIKKYVAIIGAVLSVSAGVYGMNEYFTPRETTELFVADLQKGQQLLNKQYQVNDALHWYQYFQLEVERLSVECAKDPNNQNRKAHLNYIKKQRDAAKKRLDKLMQEN